MRADGGVDGAGGTVTVSGEGKLYGVDVCFLGRKGDLGAWCNGVITRDLGTIGPDRYQDRTGGEVISLIMPMPVGTRHLIRRDLT